MADLMSSVTFDTIIIKVMPIIKTILMAVLALVLVVGVGWYLFVFKRRRSWKCNIYEKKADGRLHLVAKDDIIEKKINKGKQIIFILKRFKTEVFPPPWECCYRLHNKEYVDYLRIREDDFQPMKKSIDFDITDKTKEEKKAFFTKIRSKVQGIKSMSRQQVMENFVHIPINNALTINMKFEAMDYDINMMRINAIDNRDKIYKDKMDWIEKYGTYVAFGLIVALVLGVLYMSYGYSERVIGAVMGKVQETLSIVEQMASKIGGVPPAS